jgi:hypothetical protein
MNGHVNAQLILGTPEPFFDGIKNNPSMVDAGTPFKGEITWIDVTGSVASAILKETGFGEGLAFTNYFHLIKDDEEWKIITKTFTTE